MIGRIAAGLAAAVALLLSLCALAQAPAKPSAKSAAKAEAAKAEEPKSRLSPGRLISLPKLDDRSLRELIAAVIAKFELENGYAPAAGEALKLVPPQPPQRVSPVGVPISRATAERATALLRFGFLRQPGQLPQLWAYGVVAVPGKPLAVNPDLDTIDDTVKGIIESRKQNESGIAIGELETRVIKLSYVDADAAMVVLKSMGFNALLPPPAAAPPGGAPPAPAPAPAPADQAGGGGGDQPADQPPAEAKPDVPSIPTQLSNDDLPLIIRM